MESRINNYKTNNIQAPVIQSMDRTIRLIIHYPLDKINRVWEYLSNRVFIRHRRSENSSATTQNSPAKFCLFPGRALPFHDNSPVTLQYSPVSPILKETPDPMDSDLSTGWPSPIFEQLRSRLKHNEKIRDAQQFSEKKNFNYLFAPPLQTTVLSLGVLTIRL